jgi:mTERF domain-containing protein
MFLLETAGVPIQEVGKVLSLQPELIGCSLTKKLEVTAKFFLYHGMKREELGMMVADFPMVLKYSLSTLKPKLKYIVRVMELPLKEVIKFPR